MAEYLKLDRPLVDNAGAINETCVDCGGKGFQWKRAHIVSRVDGHVIADTYTRGDRCETCQGFGTTVAARHFSLWRAFKGALWCLPVIAVLWFLMAIS